MKILVAFATRYGTTQKCAEILGNILREKKHVVEVVDLKKTKNIRLENYDAVAVGGSFMMFKMSSLVKRFVNNNLSALLKMRTGVFMCGADESWEEEIKKGFPGQLLEKAAARGYFGFEMLWDRIGPLFRKMMQKAYKTTENVLKINEGNIMKFAEDLTEKQ